MTEAGWTRGKPSKEGVYWFRWGKDRDAIIVLVLIEYGDWRVMEMGHQHSGALAGYVTGEFFGPITPDSFQQGRVAGLVKAVEIIKANTDVKKAIEIIRLHSLAQQAQEGKGGGDEPRRIPSY